MGFYYYGRHLQAVRSGRWKLHFPHGYRTLNGRKGGSGGRPVRYHQAKTGLALYDLETDMGEKDNVADQHPDVVKRLKEFGERAREELGDRKRRKGRGVRPAGRLRR